MVSKIVNNIVDKPLKTLFKTNGKLFARIQNFVLVVYKTIVHQLFPSFFTGFYTTTSSLSETNVFHYSTYPTTITTKYIK